MSDVLAYIPKDCIPGAAVLGGSTVQGIIAKKGPDLVLSGEMISSPGDNFR